MVSKCKQHKNNKTLLCPEVLFKPHLIGKNGVPGLDQVISNVLSKIYKHIRKQFLCVKITGGSALFPGIRLRLEKDVQSGIPESVTVYTPADTLENWREGSDFYRQHYHNNDQK